MSHTAYMLRKTNDHLIHASNSHRMAALEAEGDLAANRCRGCGKPSLTIWCEACHKQAHCEHGKPLDECHACDVAGDLAFDAMREDALGGRR